MKYCYLFLMLTVAFTKAQAATVPGYIVTLNNDTIAVQIKFSGGGIFGYNMNKKLEVVDSSGTSKIFMPADIKAFGYTRKSKDYIYRTKPIKDGSFYFLEPVVIGAKTNLYQYEITSAGGQGVQSSTQEFYTFEKPDGTYLFMTNYAALDTFNKKLKEFYKDNPYVQQLIDTKFQARRHIQRDIRSIIDAYNKE